MNDIVTKALYSDVTEQELLDLIKQMSPDEMHEFVIHYNWDDGPEPMRSVAARNDCDLGTALSIYWLAGPIEPAASSHIASLIQFVRQRIIVGAYTRQQISVNPLYTFIPNKLQFTKYQRSGIPERLLRATPGNPWKA